MDKLKNSITILIVVGMLVFLGPFLLSESIAKVGENGIPFSFYFIGFSWLGYILFSAFIIAKKNW